MGYIKKHPIIVTLILVFFAIQLMPFIYNQEKAGDPISKVIMRINYYPYKWINSTADSLKNGWNNYINLKDLNYEYQELKKENKKLRAENFKLREIQLQNKRLKKLLNFIDEGPYESISANVIAGSPSLLRTEFIIIDKGKEAGVYEGMPVATESGIVGRIYFVGEKSSQIMLITDPLSAVDAIVQRTRVRGIVKGNGSKCILDYIEDISTISKGDKVISSGKDGFYPKGIVIGTIEELDNSNGLVKATLKPEVNLNSLEEVLVIKKLKKEISFDE